MRSRNFSEIESISSVMPLIRISWSSFRIVNMRSLPKMGQWGPSCQSQFESCKSKKTSPFYFQPIKIYRFIANLKSKTVAFSFPVSAKNLDITQFVDYVMFLTLRILWKNFISFLITHNPSADHNISPHKLSFSFSPSFFPWRPKFFPPPKFSYITWLELANSSHLIFFRFFLCIVFISRHC